MRIAALDLGSNSFHLLVAEVRPDGTFEPIAREKEMLRLGDALSREGHISQDKADQAVAVVRRFRRLADTAGATEILACATSATRGAANGDELVDRFEREAGVRVEVINGLEEARLIFGAIRAAVLIDPGPAVCFDLGGGSVEVMVGDTGGMRYAASERVGVGRLTAELVRSDPLSKDDRRRLRERIEQVMQRIADEVAPFEPTMAIGSAGTLNDLAHMVAARRGEEVPPSLNQLRFTREEFLELHHDILAAKASERRRMEGLEAKRVDLIPAGSMFLAVTLELFALDALTVSEWGLREGIVLDAVGHHDPADWSDDPRAIRRASVHSLARRCSWPETHSRQVAELALRLFDQTEELHRLDATDRELLEYGALLHDIGEHVSAYGHHRHAAYLIVNGQLRGFSPEEIRVLAALARWHRRGEPKSNDDLVGPLDASTLGRVRRLAALLRVADGLDRSREGLVEDVTVQLGPSLVLLGVTPRGDVELELWGARRKRDLFEKVFERELEVTVHPTARR